MPTIRAKALVTPKEFLDFLRKHRKRYPIKRLSEQAGIPRSVIYKAQAGADIEVATLQAIARVVGGSVCVIIKDNPP